MSLASRAGDVYYSFRFIKLLTTPFEETDASKSTEERTYNDGQAKMYLREDVKFYEF